MADEVASMRQRLGKRPEIESLDYDIDASTLYETHYSRQAPNERRWDVFYKWLVCGLSGCTTGALAFVVDYTCENLEYLKWNIAAYPLERVETPKSAFATATAALTLFSLVLVAVASCLVLFCEPIAAGSGIPEVKTYLQGCRIPRMLRISTLFCKAAGVLCSVAGGLVCGKEGPMIHAGAIIASGFSQGSSKTLQCRTSLLKRFRNDHDKRDFVSAGAAAGVAAAFGAPIGGVLFALEEAATHWSQQLTWRTFFCAICSTGSLNLLLSITRDKGRFFGMLSYPGLITFGSFLDCQENDTYYLKELLVFSLIGVICGALGAGFNALNRRLTLFRQRRLRTRRSRLLEALLVGFLTSVVCCALPFLPFLKCVPRPPSMMPPPMPPSAPPGAPPVPSDISHRHHHQGRVLDPDRCNPQPNPFQNFTHRFVCGDDGYESPLVRLLLAPHDEGIKVLFHAPAEHGVSLTVSAIFFAFSFVFGLLTYGLALPSGLFVPCIMCGAAVGRFVGEWLGPQFGDASPGSYALIGAAGMLGGVCRMTISITVIVIESTGNAEYSIPIAVTIMFAKLVGDAFTEGIYDLHIHLKGYPLLPDQPEDKRAHLQASDVMAGAVRTVSEHEQVGTLLKLLKTSKHHGFPVAKSGGGGGVLGIILRDQLITILAHRRFEPRRTTSPHLGSYFQAHAGPHSQQPPLSADDFLRPWTSVDLEQLAINFTQEDLDKVVNLRPYINEAALVTLKTTSLRRVSRLFLTMGLRHLLVVENCPKVVGMITRKDLLYGGHDCVRARYGATGEGGLPPLSLQPECVRGETRWPRMLRALRSRTRARVGNRSNSLTGATNTSAVYSCSRARLNGLERNGIERSRTASLSEPMLSTASSERTLDGGRSLDGGALPVPRCG